MAQTGTEAPPYLALATELSRYPIDCKNYVLFSLLSRAETAIRRKAEARDDAGRIVPLHVGATRASVNPEATAFSPYGVTNAMIAAGLRGWRRYVINDAAGVSRGSNRGAQG